MVEDIKCLVRDISDNFNELRMFYQLLGLSNVELEDLYGFCLDIIDNVLIFRYFEFIIQEKCKNIIYQGLVVVLDYIFFYRRDFLQKYCFI